ncbi:MAG: hypothetical protein KDA50_10685 [Rhodobacteraceae bacterium]|nr:hypothetical protein [Paracoccaceae bacterium]
MAMEEDIVLHVGAPKCGSSSLQATLSEAPDFQSRSNHPYSYVALTPQGRLLRSEKLTSSAHRTVFGYAASPDIAPDDTPAWLSQGADPIRQLVEEGITPILSAEGWINRAKRFREAEFLTGAKLTAHVIVFIRPPMEWLNSAWWQWGAWSNTTVERFVRANVEAARWNMLVTSWLRLPGVKKVTVRLADSDSVKGFFDILDVEPPVQKRTNSGIPASLRYFMTRNREFRASPHEPATEFAAARQLNWTEPTPWVIDTPLAGFVIRHLTQANKNLLDKFSAEDRAKVEQDPRWWDLDLYSARALANPADFSTSQALRDLATAMHTRLEAQRRALPADVTDRLSQWSDSMAIADADAILTTLLREILALDESQRQKT